MKNKIEDILQPLVSLPLWDLGRAGSIDWFAFGVERRIVSSLRNGETKVVSEYAFHAECPWRIRYQDTIILASDDRFGEIDDNLLNDLNFGNQMKENLLDVKTFRFLEENKQTPLIVDSLIAREWGDIVISLNQTYSLEVFINNTFSGEHWRFFKPYSAETHFIFTSNGLSFE